MTKTERAWLAGFFDGEGCISTTKNKNVHISINQKFPGVLYHIKVLLECGRISSSPNAKQFWITGKGDCKKFIQAILPYSVVKKSQLTTGLKLLKLTRQLRGGIKLSKSTEYRKQQLTKKLKGLKRKESVKL